MRRLLTIAILLLCSSAAYGQAKELIDFSGGVAGTSPTTAQMQSSIFGCGLGTVSGTSNANLTVQTAAVPAFPWPVTICGQTFTGSTTKALSWLTGTGSASVGFNFPAGVHNHASFGLFFCENFDVTTAATGQYSNVDIASGSGNDANIVTVSLSGQTHPGSGVALENSCGNNCALVPNQSYKYKGGNCTTDQTAWIFISIEHNGGAGNFHKMWVYDYTTKTLLASWIRPTPAGSNPLNGGLLEIGISGAEAEEVGHRLYWSNILITWDSDVGPLLPDRPWAPVLSPARAANWENAGVIGGIPSASWTQCGATLTPGVTAAQIASAISACGTNQFVLLGPGTFNLDSNITWPSGKSNVALRGSGSNSTFLVFPSTTAGSHLILVSGNVGTPAFIEWTGQFNQGASVINVASIPAGVVTGQTVVVLNQCETGFTGDTCAGTSTDDSGFFSCSQKFAAGPPATGCGSSGPDGANTGRYVQETSVVSQVDVSLPNIQLQDSLKHPDWALGRTPHALFYNSLLSNVGIENMSIDGRASGLNVGGGTGVEITGVLNSWLLGTRIIGAARDCFSFFSSVHSTAQNNYCAASNTTGIGSRHGYAGSNSSRMLILNNIFNNYTTAMHDEDAVDSSVYAYNYVTGYNNGSDVMQESVREHSNGAMYALYEGNVGGTWRADITHGSELAQTTFRNFMTGWASCANGQCGSSTKDFGTVAIQNDGYSRYHNHIGDVLGTPGYANNYISTSGSSHQTIYNLGRDIADSVPEDLLTQTTVMLWGVYDTVNAAVRFNNAEVPSSLTLLPNPIPANTTLPASFFLSAEPPIFGTLTWPPIGPDVTGGNIGQCSGTLNVAGQYNGLPSLSNVSCGGHGITLPAWGGHVNANAAMNCYLNIMGGTPDGLDGVLAFDSSVCYTSSSGGTASVAIAPSPMTFPAQRLGIASSRQDVTVTNNGTISVTMGSTVATIVGPNAADFTLTTDSTSCAANQVLTISVGSNLCTVAVIFTPTANPNLGVETAQLNIFDNATGNPQAVQLSGTGIVLGPAPQVIAGMIQVSGSLQ